MQSKPIIIYTDGSAFNNPGPGGWAAIMAYGDYRKEFSEGYYKTTNNRMELMAVIEALRKLKENNWLVYIYTDSKYVANAVNKGWVFNWEKKGFQKKKNPDLWQAFLKEYRKHSVTLDWVEGHAGQEENERCDKLAKKAAENPVKEDTGFVKKTMFD